MENYNTITKPRFALNIFTGCSLGIAYFLSPGGFCVIMCTLIITIVMAQKFWHTPDGRFLLILFSIAFFFRVISVLIIDSFLYLTGMLYQHVGTKVAGIWGDSNLYTVRSWFMVTLADNPKLFYNYFSSGYGHGGHLYILSLFHHIFGFSPTSSKLINCFLGAFNGVIAYGIGYHLSGKQSAKIFAVLTVAFPSLFFWSISNLKDVPFITLTLLTIYSLILFKKKPKARFPALILLCLFLQYQLRINMSVPLIPVSLFAVIWIFLRSRVNKAVFSIITCLLILFKAHSYSDINLAALNFVKTMLKKHVAMVLEGGIPYYLLPAHYYPAADFSNITFTEIAATFVKGWYYLLFSPFPWKISSASQAVSLPQMIIWYFLMIMAISGIFIGIKKNPLIISAVLFYIFIMGTLISLADGNVGTLFRHRDMISPLVMLLSAISLPVFVKRAKSS